MEQKVIDDLTRLRSAHQAEIARIDAMLRIAQADNGAARASTRRTASKPFKRRGRPPGKNQGIGLTEAIRLSLKKEIERDRLKQLVLGRKLNTRSDNPGKMFDTTLRSLVERGEVKITGDVVSKAA